MVTENQQTLSDELKGIVELKITIPLSPATKKLHTREFIRTKLSLPTLRKLAKLDKSYNVSELDQYKTNVWSIHKIDIKVNNSTEEMQLTLTPFSEDISKEAQTLQGFRETSSTNQRTTQTTSELNTNDLQGDSFLKNTVKKAIGSKKGIKEQADACLKYFNQHHVYNLYYDFQRGGKNFKKTWNTRGLNCGDGAVAICNMLYCLGLKPEMRLGSAREIGESYGHYWVVVEINGRTYYCDHANGEGMAGRSHLSTSGTDYGHNPRAGRVVSWK